MRWGYIKIGRPFQSDQGKGIASGLMALSISMGVCAVWLSLRTKLPISVAWSTPGGALLATWGRRDRRPRLNRV